MVFSLLNHGSDGLESKAQFFCLPVLAAPFLSFCSDDKMCAFLMMTSLRSAHVFLQTQSSAAKNQPKPFLRLAWHHYFCDDFNHESFATLNPNLHWPTQFVNYPKMSHFSFHAIRLEI